MNIFTGEKTETDAAELLSETGMAAEHSEAVESRGPPVEGKASREVKWRPDLTKKQLERLLSWVQHDIQTSTNSVTESANWTFRTFDGLPVFAIYSTENESDSTILYEVKGEQAEYERDYLKNLLEDFKHGESINGKPVAIDEVLGRSWMRKTGSIANDNGTVVGGGGSGDAGVLRQQPGRKPRAAFKSVLRNLFQVRDGGVTDKASRETITPTDLTEEQQDALSATQDAVRTTVREELDRMGKEYGWIKAGESPARSVQIPKKTEILPIFKGKGKSESIAAPAPVSSVGFVDCRPYTQGQIRQRTENVGQCGIIHADESLCNVLGVVFGHRTIFIHCFAHKAKNAVEIVQLIMYVLQIKHARSPPSAFRP